MSKTRRKFRDNGNNLISATRPQHTKVKGEVSKEFRMTDGNGFRKSINLYWSKRKKEKTYEQ